MSAIVCGKRSFFEDLSLPLPTSAVPPVSKKLRRSDPFSPPPPPPVFPSPIDQLRAAFPDMDNQLIDKALEECGNDLSSAIKRLNELRIGYAEGGLDSAAETNAHMENGTNSTNGDQAVPSEDAKKQSNLPIDGVEWVELLVREMMSATSIDHARSRATRVLDSLERSISASARARAEASENFAKENILLKEQIEALLRENSILKRAVAIQHERQKEYDERTQEAQQLKQLVAQYQEQLRTLEVNNYALTMHLQQAQHGHSIPGRFHPDVF